MFEDWSDYSAYEGAAPAETATDQGFFQNALNTVNEYLAPIQDFSKTPVGSQLFEAIYAYGAGKIDQAREKAVGAFLMTSEGQRVQREAARQTAVSYTPYLLLALGAIFFLFALRR